MSGQIGVVALRDLAAGDEICIDYAMCDGSPYDEFECGCGTPTCRGRITGDDWRRPELQARYAGYFSPYFSGGSIGWPSCHDDHRHDRPMGRLDEHALS